MSAEEIRNEEVEPAAAMRLRAELPRVTRLSRKVLAGLGLAAGLGVGGALVYGLQSQHGGKASEELLATGNRNTPDGLNALPKDYTGVPKLGPPLPGDLGRPILNAQNGGQPVIPPGMGGSAQPAAPDPEAERRRQELERRRQELEAARSAKLFAGTEARLADNAAPTSTMPGTPVPQPDLTSLGLAPQPATPSAQQRQQAFLDQAPDKRTVSPDRVAAPASANVLQAGAVIPAALITGIRSDLPGQVTAQVTENVYDSPTGRILLVPQGTRVVGQYDNGVGFGQKRVLLVWSRLIFPNGRSIVLERQPGADAEGYAGLEDGVDHHWWDLAKAAGLSTLLSIGSQAGSSGEESDIAPPSGRERPMESHKLAGRWSGASSISRRRSPSARAFRFGFWSRATSSLNHTEADIMAKLKLGPIAEDKPVKVTLELPASVHRDLVSYAEVLARDTGQPATDPVRLIAPMLERFMATDREFAKARRLTVR